MVIRLLTESLAYPGGNEERVGDAGALADDVIRLLGPDAAWWINIIERYFGGCDSWDAVTEHTFDGCLVGQGRGLSFVILAADED